MEITIGRHADAVSNHTETKKRFRHDGTKENEWITYEPESILIIRGGIRKSSQDFSLSPEKLKGERGEGKEIEEAPFNNNEAGENKGRKLR